MKQRKNYITYKSIFNKKKYKGTQKFFQKGKGLEEEYDDLIIQYMKTMVYTVENMITTKEMSDYILANAKGYGPNFIKYIKLSKNRKNAITYYQADGYKNINKLLWDIAKDNKSTKDMTDMIYLNNYLSAVIIYDAIKNYGFLYYDNVTVFRIFSDFDDYNKKLCSMKPYSFIEFNSFISTSALKPYSDSNINLSNCAKIIIPRKTPFFILSIGAGENEILLNPGTLLKINSATSECKLGDFIYIPLVNKNIKTSMENAISSEFYIKKIRN